MKKMIKIISIIIIVIFIFSLIIISAVAGIYSYIAGRNIGDPDSGSYMVPITIEAEISGNSVKYKVIYEGSEFIFTGTKHRNKLEGRYSKNSFARMELPGPPASLTKKVIEPCNTITNTTAPAYKIVHSVNSKDDGVYRKYKGMYIVALGSYYSKTMGDKFIIEFLQPDGSTKKIKAVIGDQKADAHTDPKHQYQKYDHSVVEFITAKGTERKVSATHEKVNSDFGTIKSISKYQKVDIKFSGKIENGKVKFTGTVNGERFEADGSLKNGKVSATGYVGSNFGSKKGTGEFIYPLPRTYTITSPFGYRDIDGRRNFHSGIDFGAPYGTDILASDSGTIITLGWDSTGYGKHVVIDHGNNKFTLYAHASKLTTSPGKKVKKGEKIAEVGSTGWSSGPHLHFEIRVGANAFNNAVNPAPYLGL